MVKCDVCGKVCKSERGLAMHMFVHQNKEGGVDIERDVLQSDLDTTLETFRQQKKEKLLGAYRENELLQIELENKRMRDEIKGITPQASQPEKKSELEMFEKFQKIQSNIGENQQKKMLEMKEMIMSELDERGGQEMPLEDELALRGFGLLEEEMIRKRETRQAQKQQIPAAPNIPTTSGSLGAPINQPPVKKNMATEREIFEEKIRSGKLSFKEAKELFRAKYPNVKLSEATLKKEYDRVKNG